MCHCAAFEAVTDQHMHGLEVSLLLNLLNHFIQIYRIASICRRYTTHFVSYRYMDKQGKVLLVLDPPSMATLGKMAEP